MAQDEIAVQNETKTSVSLPTAEIEPWTHCLAIQQYTIELNIKNNRKEGKMMCTLEPCATVNQCQGQS